MTTKYTFAKDAGPDDWSALPHQFKKGDVIFDWSGHDYGLARDDTIHSRLPCISCCEVAGKHPFFTVPTKLLLTEEGHEPMGEYFIP